MKDWMIYARSFVAPFPPLKAYKIKAEWELSICSSACLSRKCTCVKFSFTCLRLRLRDVKLVAYSLSSFQSFVTSSLSKAENIISLKNG